MTHCRIYPITWAPKKEAHKHQLMVRYGINEWVQPITNLKENKDNGMAYVEGLRNVKKSGIVVAVKLYQKGRQKENFEKGRQS